ncbi:hypothetical protein SynRS9902_02542 [Synechococcus sp. RS9902]|nr:hypothetical protein SynRS9902_02542 [Synechococcus sp. RS9902]
MAFRQQHLPLIGPSPGAFFYWQSAEINQHLLSKGMNLPT